MFRPNPEPRTPNPEPRTPNPEPRIPNPEPYPASNCSARSRIIDSILPLKGRAASG